MTFLIRILNELFKAIAAIPFRISAESTVVDLNELITIINIIIVIAQLSVHSTVATAI